MKAILRLNAQIPTLSSRLEPEVGVGDVLIRIQAAGICATDLAIINGHYYNPLVLGEVILGHEGYGVIEKLGEGVTTFERGQAVIFETVYSCGRCPACAKGKTNYCDNWHHIGINVDGVFAEYIKVPASTIHRIPAHVPVSVGVLGEPLAIVFNTISRIKEDLIDRRVIIVGPGCLGVLHALVFSILLKPSEIVVIGQESDNHRLRKIASLGFTTCTVSQVPSLSGKAGVVIEVGGSASSLETAMASVNAGGTIYNLGLCHERTIKPADIIRIGAMLSPGRGILAEHMYQAAEFIALHYSALEGVVGEWFTLENFHDAIRSASQKSSFKVALHMN